MGVEAHERRDSEVTAAEPTESWADLNHLLVEREPHAVYYRYLAPGYGLWVCPLFFTHRLIIGPVQAETVDDAWCYHDAESAIAAAEAWDPAKDSEPTGWHRHPVTDRRRPGGDPALERIGTDLTPDEIAALRAQKGRS